MLETHSELKLDTKKVADAWPAELERPTPRAITERLARLRKDAGAHLTVAKGGKGDADNAVRAQDQMPASVPSTPKKSQPKDEERTPGGSGGKRKRPGEVKKTKSQDDMERTISDREVAQLQAETIRFMKMFDAKENGFDEPRGTGRASPEIKDEVDALESPTKRLRIIQYHFDHEEGFEDDDEDEN